jgi:hypothetical protein
MEIMQQTMLIQIQIKLLIDDKTQHQQQKMEIMQHLQLLIQIIPQTQHQQVQEHLQLAKIKITRNP